MLGRSWLTTALFLAFALTGLTLSFSVHNAGDGAAAVGSAETRTIAPPVAAATAAAAAAAASSRSPDSSEEAARSEQKRLGGRSAVVKERGATTLPDAFPLFPLPVHHLEYPYDFAAVESAGFVCESPSTLLKGGGAAYRLRSCYNATACHGYVEVRLLDRADAAQQQQRVSGDAGWDAWLRANVGPDSFRLVWMSEEEMAMAYQEYDKEGSGGGPLYRLRFAFTRPGVYKARFKLELSEYWGVNEAHHNTAHWKNKEVAYLPAYACTAILPVLRSPQPRTKLGRWVKRALPLASRVKGSEWQWAVYGEEQPLGSYTPKQAAACLRQTRADFPVQVRVVGDSQARSVYHALKGLLAQEDASWDVVRRKVANASTAVAGGDISLKYTADMFLEDLKSIVLDHVLFIGFGAHPASWGQWTFQKMKDHMSKVADALCERKGPTVWFGAPAWPKAKSASVANWRVTNPRLGIFNRLAEAAIRHRNCSGVQIVDAFSMSLPQLKLSRDGAHYDKTVVMGTFVDLLLKALCT
eukprot:Rhum_TRINITY_DN13311_c0_g1::Rhum_TRINITY_DN13311_c0_g1_i3::g.58965::m.58965